MDDNVTMGNRFSFHGQSTGGWDFLFFPRRKSVDFQLPTCSDELMDWCFICSKIFRLYLEKGLSRVNVHENECEKSKGVDLSTNISFAPYVLNGAQHSVSDLPSMNNLDRMKFLGENASERLFSSNSNCPSH